MQITRVRVIRRMTEGRNESPLFFSFVGTATSAALKKEKKVEEKPVLPVVEPSLARK